MQNDLDLDLFTEIIHTDISDLKRTPCFNSYHSHSSTKASRSIPETTDFLEVETHARQNREGEYAIGNELFGTA
jgi:hypothetical protein